MTTDDKPAKLLARLMRASGPDQALDEEILAALDCVDLHPAPITFSVDVALDLVNRVLPDWGWEVMTYDPPVDGEKGHYYVRMSHKNNGDLIGIPIGAVASGGSDYSLSLAILIALMCALIGREENEQLNHHSVAQQDIVTEHQSLLGSESEGKKGCQGGSILLRQEGKS